MRESEVDDGAQSHPRAWRRDPLRTQASVSKTVMLDKAARGADDTPEPGYAGTCTGNLGEDQARRPAPRQSACGDGQVSGQVRAKSGLSRGPSAARQPGVAEPGP